MLREVKIHIPNAVESISISSASIKEYAHLVGFRRRDANKITQITEEVLKQIIKCFYLEEQVDEIIVHLEHITEGLRITINDHGIPMDVEKIQSCDDHDQQGFGMVRKMLHQYMNVVSFEAKGFAGNETIFEKHLKPKKQISETDEHSILQEELEHETHKDISVRLLDKEESNAISKLAYIAYHYSYPYELIYIPKKVQKEIERKHMFSAVGILGDDNKIISHTALVLSDSSSKTAEIGIAFTDPMYRGYGCMQKLWTYLIDDVAASMKLFGVFAMAVCSHPYSQKACHKMQLLDTALLVSRAPVLGFESIEVEEKQRESLMIAFRVLNQPEKVTFYVPKHHKKMVLAISKQLGLNAVIAKHPLFSFDSNHTYSNLEVSNDDVFKVSNIVLNHIGRDIKQVFEENLQKLKNARYESIYLFLDLADYHTEKYTSYFESKGFFFAGIMHKENRMNLVLQYLNNQDYHFASLQIASDFGQVLANYVEAEYEKNRI
ncbi:MULTISPECIES: ATP-binding protein [unclassified Lentimicrobium]|uniref:ATP-binding protein n=1 Tax=unclassified Lentimicrobium TaxID=2677434 RepID=UPI001554568C|nr:MULTISPECIES: hypothetical protein [unclassified Lentimicrobium]NPD44716.1 hypothetical protein [Lentimicrobium sp. S6]NPD83428.1 hypothetical protein [Lentimicrobium sp. L6]